MSCLMILMISNIEELTNLPLVLLNYPFPLRYYVLYFIKDTELILLIALLNCLSSHSLMFNFVSTAIVIYILAILIFSSCSIKRLITFFVLQTPHFKIATVAKDELINNSK